MRPASAIGLAALLLSAAAQAAPTLDGVNLGEHAAGPRVSPKDLKGRVVAFEYWGVDCAPCKAAIPHLAELQDTYDYRYFILVADQCDGGTAAETAKVWREHKGGERVAVVHGGGLPGALHKSIPHAYVFDAQGKLVFDGHPAVPEFAAAIEKAVMAVPGAAESARRKGDAKARLQEIFGKDLPEDARKLAAQLLDTAKSSALPCQALERAAAAKDPKVAGPAKAMLAAFKAHVAGAYAEAVKLADDQPAEAWAKVELFTRWVPHLDEGVQAQRQLALWRRDTAFMRELVADKAWLALKAQADKIGFDQNPKARPTNQLEVDFKKLLNDKALAGTKGLAKAKAAADGWKLDPATGRADKWKPAPKSGAPAETKTSF